MSSTMRSTSPATDTVLAWLARVTAMLMLGCPFVREMVLTADGATSTVATSLSRTGAGG